jgi:hypothetical protein
LATKCKISTGGSTGGCVNDEADQEQRSGAKSGVSISSIDQQTRKGYREDGADII